MIEIEHFDTTKEQRNWAMGAHLAAFAMYPFPAFGAIVGPLIVWLLKKDEMPFVRDQGREALNFNLWVLILAAAFLALTVIGIGFFLLGLLHLFQIVFIIVAAVHASDGKTYRYPFTIRLIK